MVQKTTPHGGWYNQPDRHALASKGVQTTQKTTKSYALSSKIPQCYESGKRRIELHIGNIFQKNLLERDKLELYRELITIKKIIDKNDIDVSTDELEEMIGYLDKRFNNQTDSEKPVPKSINLEEKFNKFLDEWKKHQKKD